jgi:hypothetical protein
MLQMTAEGSRFSRRLFLAATLTTFAFAPARAARADITKDECIDANGRAQDLRRDGKLLAAREQLRECASAPCPAMVREDCASRLDELQRAQPTIVFEVRDELGVNLTAVRVTVDGTAITDRLDGAPLPVDVGEHVFAFATADRAPVTRTLVIVEGQKERRVRIALAGTVRPSGSPGSAPAVAGHDESPARAQEAGPVVVLPASVAGPSDRFTPGRGMGTQKILGVAAGSAGVAGVAVGSVFGLMAISEKSRQSTDCGSAQSCTASGRARALHDRSNGITDGAISSAGFIAGGALIIAGAALFFSAAPSPDQRAGTSLVVFPVIGPGAGEISLIRTF